MREARFARCWFLLLLILPLAARAAVSAVDDRGREIVLAAPATRIVSLAPNVTELLFAAGAGDRVVGVVAYSDYPPPARTIAQVGDASRIDAERVLALRPDLVVGWDSGNPRAAIERLERLGVPVYVIEPRRLESIGEYVRTLGRLAGTEATAQAAAARYAQGLDELRARYAQRPVLRVFYQLSAQPLMTVNGEHLISQVLALCGGRNVFADLSVLAPSLSVESVIAADPQAIVAGHWQQDAQTDLAHWRRFPMITAVRTGNLYGVHADYLVRATPRILEGARAVCEDLDRARAGEVPDAAQ